MPSIGAHDGGEGDEEGKGDGDEEGEGEGDDGGEGEGDDRGEGEGDGVGEGEGDGGGGVGQVTTMINQHNSCNQNWWKETIPTLLQAVAPQATLLFSREHVTFEGKLLNIPRH